MNSSNASSLFPVPPAAAERMLAAMTRLSAAADMAAVSPAADPAGLESWRQIPNYLHSLLTHVETAVERFRAGDEGPLVKAASQLRFLARDMDGYSLSVAGEPFAGDMEQARRLLIQVSWQVHAAASGHPASGL